MSHFLSPFSLPGYAQLHWGGGGIIKPGSAEARQLELVITLLGGSQPSCLLPSCPHLSSVTHPQCPSSALTVWKGLPPDPASDPALRRLTHLAGGTVLWVPYRASLCPRLSLE